ncbi:ALP1-like protein [Tanacetum coccineum]
MNTFFVTNDDDEERRPDSFEVDDETDVYFLEQAYAYHEHLQQEENRPRLTPVVRQLAYSNTPGAFDEYLQMSEHTARDCLFLFNKCIIDLYMSNYLRKPTLEDVEKYILNMWMLTVFRECLKALIVCTGNGKIVKYHGRDNTVEEIKKYPTIILEAVASHDLWIWHAFFGVAGANNDINFLDNSLLFDDKAQLLRLCYFKKRQESARKDVERAFGVLQER